MGLKKQIELENGIKLEYHRIVSLNKITNMTVTIEINSYANKEQREKEKEYQNIQKKKALNEELSNEEQIKLEKGINVFIDADYINIPYDENITIEEIYEYLKTTEKYKNAEDT